MAKSHTVQTNFTAGELSPVMLGRCDVNKYGNGAASLRNFLVRQQGPLWRRSGSQYIGTVKTPAKKTIIREFTFSDAQEYVLEIGEGYVRVWLNGGFVETAPSSGVPLEIVTPYQEADLINLRFTQSGDILYVVSPSYPPLQIERLGANSWTAIPFSPLDGPYLDTDTSETNMILDSVQSVANGVATAPLFGAGPATHTITAIASNGGLVKITAAGHGLVVGDSCVVSGLTWTVVVTMHGALWSTTTSSVPYPSGNGQYVVTAVSGNDVTLADSSFLTSAGGLGIPQYTYTYHVTGSTVRLTGSTAVNWVDYRDGGTWRIAYIGAVTDSKHALLSPVLQVKDDLSPNVVLSVANGVMTADHSGVFNLDDRGKYVKIVQNNTWYFISSVTSDSVVNVVGVTTLAYDYTQVTLNVSNWVVSGRVRSSANEFVATDIDRHIRFNFSGLQPWCKITTYISATQVKVIFPDHQVPMDRSTKLPGGVTDVWRLGAWSATTGFPSEVQFHEQRIWFSGTPTQPQSMWSSKSGDYTRFSPSNYDSSVADDNAISYTLTSNRANPILWMISGPTMLVGTLGAEYQVKASTLGQPLSPTNIMILPQTEHGSLSTGIPFRIGYAVLFVQRAGRKLMELTYEFTLDSYTSRDLTITSEHIFRQGGQAFRLAYQKEPNSMLWACLTDGTLACLTYEREQQVSAWHGHSLGGGSTSRSLAVNVHYQGVGGGPPTVVVNGTTPTAHGFNVGDKVTVSGCGNALFNVSATVTAVTSDGLSFSYNIANPGGLGIVLSSGTVSILGGSPLVESIASVSSGDGTCDELYMVVNRVVAGVQTRYIEKFVRDFYPTGATDKSTMWYLDCAARYTGAPATTITGLDFLNGDVVSIVADGAVLPDQAVVGNQITLAKAASDVLVGYNFTSTLQILPVEIQSQAGSAQGYIKRPNKVMLRLLNSLGFKYGSDLTKMVVENFRDIPTDPMDSSPPLFTGDRVYNLPAEYTRTGQFYAVQDQPYPLNILLISQDTSAGGM